MKHHKYYILLLITAIFFIACDDFLDEKPSKNSSLVITDIDQLEYLLNSYGSYYTEPNRTLIYSSDDYGLLTDLYDAKSSAYGLAGVQFATWDIEYLPLDNRERFWSGEYSKIFNANMILSNLGKVSGTAEKKEQIKQEAHLIRAMSMWNLAQTYCLPYTEANQDEMGMVLKKSTSFEEPVNRATLKETYDFIESDLEEALKLTTKIEMVNNKYRSWRGSKGAANAFAARYYLNRNDYTNSLKHADVALQEHKVLMNYNTDMKYSDIPSNVTVEGVPIPIKYPYTHDNQSDLTDMLEWKEFYTFRLLNHESWWYVPSPELLSLYDKAYDLRYKYHMVENYSYDRGLTNPPLYFRKFGGIVWIIKR